MIRSGIILQHAKSTEQTLISVNTIQLQSYTRHAHRHRDSLFVEVNDCGADGSHADGPHRSPGHHAVGDARLVDRQRHGELEDAQREIRVRRVPRYVRKGSNVNVKISQYVSYMRTLFTP